MSTSIKEPFMDEIRRLGTAVGVHRDYVGRDVDKLTRTIFYAMEEIGSPSQTDRMTAYIRAVGCRAMNEAMRDYDREHPAQDEQRSVDEQERV